MTQKVFILTDQEIAGYTAAHQQQLLNALEQVSLEHPTATVPELLAYARQQLVIAPAEEDMSYKALTAQEERVEVIPELVPEADPEVYEEPDFTGEVAVVEEEPTLQEEQYPVYEEAPVYEEPVQPEYPVYEEPVQETQFPVYQEPAYTPPVEPVQEEPEEDESEQSIAFRSRRYQGLFHEASKLDEG